MKPSDLKKDSNFSGRINSEIKEKLKELNISVQEIVDSYIDKNIEILTRGKNERSK